MVLRPVFEREALSSGSRSERREAYNVQREEQQYLHPRASKEAYDRTANTLMISTVNPPPLCHPSNPMGAD